MTLSISPPTFEHHLSPLGISEPTPRISWRFTGHVPNWFQDSYDVQIHRPDLLHSPSDIFHVNSSDSVLVPWPSTPLESGEEAVVRVRSFGHAHGRDTGWSEGVSVEAGLLSPSDWQGAEVIVSTQPSQRNDTKRPVYFSKEFALDDFDDQEEVKKARLYITALGLYEAHINGERVGDHVLAPGWQSYTHRHEYNTYDVTGLLQGGKNALDITVGEGWYSGRLSWGEGVRNVYGDELGVLCLLVVTKADGRKVFIRSGSDGSWKSGTGPIVTSEIYDGERYDSRLDESNWVGVREVGFDKGLLAAPDGPPIRRVEEVTLQQVFRSASGKTVLDFGQNLVGWLRIRVKGARGETIRLVHTEVMENGEVATRPLRTAKQTDHLTLSGSHQEWEPSFTYHGFRYVQVDNWPTETPLDSSAVTAIVVHSDMEPTGFFSCSNDLLNRLHENILWSMRGNFMSIPTDCPQRDERLGWTGDIHAFSRTANFLYNTAGFLRAWLKDAYSEQMENNYAPPHVIPNVLGPAPPTSIWGDSIVGVPFALFSSFGDIPMLREQYPGAQIWLDKGIPRNEAGLWNRSTFQYADWLDPKAPADDPGAATTDAFLVSDAYLVHSTAMVGGMAGILGLEGEEGRYEAQRERLAEAWRDAWISGEGMVVNETQTGLTLPLYFGLFGRQEEAEAAVRRLVGIIEGNGYKVGTGFAGTHLLGHTLSKFGEAETFYEMLLQTGVPSWLFQVVMNGTTTWERWDSMLANGSVNAGEMTSFNHYAVGSVGAWMHESIGGLSAVEPGWKRFNVQVRPGGGLSEAETRLLSPYGAVATRWTVKNGVFKLEVEVPPNSQAVVTLPGETESEVVGSGVHHYTVSL